MMNLKFYKVDAPMEQGEVHLICCWSLASAALPTLKTQFICRRHDSGVMLSRMPIKTNSRIEYGTDYPTTLWKVFYISYNYYILAP